MKQMFNKFVQTAPVWAITSLVIVLAVVLTTGLNFWFSGNCRATRQQWG